jgi:hypothetical protein
VSTVVPNRLYEGSAGLHGVSSNSREFPTSSDIPAMVTSSVGWPGSMRVRSNGFVGASRSKILLVCNFVWNVTEAVVGYLEWKPQSVSPTSVMSKRNLTSQHMCVSIPAGIDSLALYLRLV